MDALSTDTVTLKQPFLNQAQFYGDFAEPPVVELMERILFLIDADADEAAVLDFGGNGFKGRFAIAGVH